MNHYNYFLFVLIFSGFGIFNGQEIKEETLILERKRTPETELIHKKSLPLEWQNLGQEKERVDYQITQFPPVLNFQSTGIPPKTVDLKFPLRFFDHYVQLGYGNFGTWQGKGMFSHEFSPKKRMGIALDHLSTAGFPKKIIPSNSHQSNTEIQLFFQSKDALQRKDVIESSLDFQHQEVSYYGWLSPEKKNPKTPLSFTGNHFNALGWSLKAEDQHWRLKTDIHYFQDQNSSREWTFDAGLAYQYKSLDISNIVPLGTLDTKVEAGYSQQCSHFQLKSSNFSKHGYFYLFPHLVVKTDGAQVKLGIKAYYLSEYQRYQMEEVKVDTHRNKARFFPDVEASVRFSEGLHLYGGAQGGVALNTFKNTIAVNPYIFPNANLQPSITKYLVFAGLRSDWEMIKYDISAGFSHMENDVFFSGMPTEPHLFLGRYDQNLRSYLRASLEVFPLEELQLFAEVELNKNQPKTEKTAFHRPAFQGNFGAKYRLNTHWDFSTSTIVVSARKNREYTKAGTSTVVTKPSYFDANLKVQYHFSNRLTAYLSGHNLFNTNYEHWVGYPVLGAQVLAGLRLGF